VLGENISQAAQFVQSGNAEVGIVALSLTLSPEAKSVGVSHDIPANAYPPIEQAAVILASSKHVDVARQFVAFLKKPDVVRLLQSYGFSLPAPR
jgi:molybdate transport system substrate-binding protein